MEASRNLEANLRFANYCNNRFLYPDVAPERWELVYGPEAAEHEKRLALEVLCA